MKNIVIQTGHPLPMGINIDSTGVNFSVFSRNATKVFLEIFENETDKKPSMSIELDPQTNRTGDLWHVHLQGLKPQALYLYRVDGPFNPKEGFRFNKNNYLIDPYAKALTNKSIFQHLNTAMVSVDEVDVALGQIPTAENFPKCVVIDDEFDWQGDRPLNYPLQKCILYEAHLKGVTKDSSAKVKNSGTYEGLIEKIPYFKDLGITSLELLPIHEFDEFENSNINPKNAQRLTNYWGYSTINFFAPKASYASNSLLGGQVAEFKKMVREFHKAGIEIILDIVFNHTAEGNEKGITLSFRGFDNSIYYILDKNDKQYFANYSGCGNTVNCNHPILREFILDSLRYWVTEMHVDGFRFDLGSILGRDQNGNMLENPPILEKIAEDPVLRNTKIIAEAWDAGGAYQVGCFPGGRWAEWNDQFSNDVRRFWRGDDFMCTSLATRMSGSSDLYSNTGRKPFHSINFLTNHDGFTLNDLVSYNGKHNEENGENNQDGNNNNNSYNYGFEGMTTNAAIEAVRVRQIKNFILTLLLSQGTPMILGGDEFRRTQRGNNNAYCQDNEISHFDWTLLKKHKEIFEFTKKAILFRKNHPAFRRADFFIGKDLSSNSLLDITWYNELGQQPNWDLQNKFLSFRLDGSREEIIAEIDDNDFFIMMNASEKDITVKITNPRFGKKWYRCIDTSVEFPVDFLPEEKAEYVDTQNLYVVPSRSMAVLISK
ncbi:MAG: glycogen debranching protein GlgX [Treponemataceae bacterium]